MLDFYVAQYRRLTLEAIYYFRERHFYLPNQHFLVRLVKLLTPNLDYDIETQARVWEQKIPTLIRELELTSSLTYGKFRQGVIYGERVPHLILAHSTYFNIYFEKIPWQNHVPVKVLRHPFSDFNIGLLDGRDISSGEGLAVIAINPLLLAFQYRSFLVEQRLINNGDYNEDPALFISRYVLPNLLLSHFDLVLFNRSLSLFDQTPSTESIKPPPFPWIDYSKQIDEKLSKLLMVISRTPLFYDTILRLLPGVSSNHLKQGLWMPNIVPTRQVEWALILTRLNVMDFLIRLNGEKGVRKNKHDITQLQWLLRRVEKSRLLEEMLPTKLLSENMTIIEHLQQL